MSKPIEVEASAAHILNGKSIEELLLLIADNEKGYRSEAIDKLLAMGLEKNFPVFERAVRDDDNADLRNGAMEILVRFGVKSAPQLIKLLEDPNEEIRNFSAVMLGDIGRREAVGALILALGDPDMNVRLAVAEALGKIGDRAAIPPLLNSLKSDFWLQYAAISALGSIGDYQAAPYLLEILEDENWSGPVVEALCKIGDPRSLKPLADIIPQLEENLCAAVTKALVSIYLGLNENLRFKNSLVEYNKGELKDIISCIGIQKIRNLLTSSKEKETIEAAMTLLGWLGEAEAVNDFFRHLTDTGYMKTVESAVFSIGMPAVPYLQAALSHENNNVKIVVLHSLRWLGVIPDPGQLEDLFSQADVTVQVEALELLADVHPQRILPKLFNFFVNGDEETCLKVAEVLAGYPLHTIREFLSSLAASEDAERRRKAALLLGLLRDCGDSGLIETLVVDQNIQVRKEAIKAAGMQKLVCTVPMIHQALSDPDPGVKETAVFALAGFGSDPEVMGDVLNLFGKYGEILDYAVIKAVGIAGFEKAGAVLLEELQKKQLSNNIIYSILETLGKISYKPASVLIINQFLHHQDLDIRRLAVEVLGIFCDQNSIQGIQSVVRDPHWSVRITALKALVKIAGPNQTQVILDALQDNDSLVKKYAIITLGNLRDVKTISEIVKQLADREMSEFACEAILNFGRSALPYLHRFMKKDGTSEIREKIIDLIGKIGESSSVVPLMELLEDPNPNVRLAAIDSLAFCFDSVPLKKLIHIRNYDGTEEVKNRADLALKTFMLETY